MNIYYLTKSIYYMNLHNLIDLNILGSLSIEKWELSYQVKMLIQIQLKLDDNSHFTEQGSDYCSLNHGDKSSGLQTATRNHPCSSFWSHKESLFFMFLLHFLLLPKVHAMSIIGDSEESFLTFGRLAWLDGSGEILGRRKFL